MNHASYLTVCKTFYRFQILVSRFLSNETNYSGFSNSAFYFKSYLEFRCGSSKKVLEISMNYTCVGSSVSSIRHIQMENKLNKDSRGALVVLEGFDRCRKTTQSSKLLKYLELALGHSAELWRFPDRNTSVGQMISSYLYNHSQLDDHTIHLLFNANHWETRFFLLS